MKKFLLLLLLVFPARAALADLGDLQKRLIEFERAYAPFERHAFGCTEPVTDPLDAEHCVPAAGSWDYANYMKARKAAMRVFNLTDPHDR